MKKTIGTGSAENVNEIHEPAWECWFGPEYTKLTYRGAIETGNESETEAKQEMTDWPSKKSS